MSIPNLPTDNLYKFIAVAGLVLAGYSAFFAYQQVWDLQLQVVRAENQEKVIELEALAINEDADRISGTKEALGEGMKEVRARRLSSNIQKLKITGKKIEIDLLIRQVWIHFILFWIGIIGGLIMSATGFYCWYMKIQKPNDDFMKRRAATINTANARRTKEISAGSRET